MGRKETHTVQSDASSGTGSSWPYRPLGWLLKGCAMLPLPLLYLLADLLYLLLCHVVRYRRKVIRENLAGSFPEKDADGLRRIERGFYRNFADYIVETIKLLHISDSTMKRRMTFSGVDIIDRALEQQRPVVCYFSHTGNWEWAPSITLHSRLDVGRDAEFCQIYRPLRNRWFDSMMLKIRGRFGAVSLPKRRAFLDLLRYRKEGMPTVTGFMSDQKPSHGDTIHVVSFLNRPTAIITGTEIVCRRLGALPVYWHISKPSRGHYHIDVLDMEKEMASTKENADAPASDFPLTDLYARLLERNIRENPALWLWSHKRWKHPVTFEMNGQKNL